MNISEIDFDEKYGLYSDLIFKISIVYLRNREDAEDVMQNVFMKLFYNAPIFTGQAAEKAWVIRVTVNCCKNELRSFWRRNVDISDAFEVIEDITDDDREVLDELAEMPPKYRAVIYLHYIEGYNVGEISQILKLSESCVKMRLSRGREMLKKSLEEVR